MSNTIMQSVFSYAVANNDLVLANAMLISPSQLNKMKYTDLVVYVQGAITSVSAVVGSLGAYNVTAADVTVWQTLCTQLDTLMSDPKNAIANRDALNKSIQLQFRDCMNILYNQCDTLAEQFKTNNIDYYNAYHDNRKLNPYTLHTQLRAHTNDDLNQPVYGIEVEILVNDPNKPNPTGTTDLDGYSLIEGIPFGVWQVKVNGNIYGPYRFKKGKSLTKHYTVAPLFAPASKKTTAKDAVKK